MCVLALNSCLTKRLTDIGINSSNKRTSENPSLSESPDAITADNVTWLQTNFSYFNNETLLSGGMQGIEIKDI